MSSKQPTPAEVAGQLEEARDEIHNLENFVLIETQAHQNWMVRAQKAEAEIERLRVAFAKWKAAKEPLSSRDLENGFIDDVFVKEFEQAPSEKGGEG